jgi:hypothetical protein
MVLLMPEMTRVEVSFAMPRVEKLLAGDGWLAEIHELVPAILCQKTDPVPEWMNRPPR